MDSKSIRYQNTRLLVDSVGGVSNFAEKIGKGQSQTSQFAGTNPIKGIGNKVAREIEEAFGKPYGWLDISHASNLYNLNENGLAQHLHEPPMEKVTKEFQSLIDSLNYLNAKGLISLELIKALQTILSLVKKN